ncbi:MAG: HigA family addiction module antitoxin [Hyphomicrobiaceae bacterium]
MVKEYPKRSPDRCPTHPGAMLREVVLPAVGLQKKDVAAALGISRQTLYDLLSERQPVTPAMAVRLSAAFGTSAETWLRMQAAYDLWHAARQVDTSQVPQLRAAV